MVVPLLIPVLVTPQLVDREHVRRRRRGRRRGRRRSGGQPRPGVVGGDRHQAPPVGWTAGVRLVAALAMAVALALAVDGVKTV